MNPRHNDPGHFHAAHPLDPYIPPVQEEPEVGIPEPPEAPEWVFVGSATTWKEGWKAGYEAALKR